jgi:hypothetical protein
MRRTKRRAVRNVADTRRVGEADALPAREYLRAVAALAEAAERGACGDKAVQDHEQGHARGRVWRCVGILGAARAASAGSASGAWPSQGAGGSVSSELLNKRQRAREGTREHEIGVGDGGLSEQARTACAAAEGP